MKDLISLHTALPDKIESNLINFRKITQMYGIFIELMQLQGVQQFPVSTNIDLINTLRVKRLETYILKQNTLICQRTFI